ncbi:MAG: hypothetical protein AAF533_20760 [Acidobacteriota bacterium]
MRTSPTRERPLMLAAGAAALLTWSASASDGPVHCNLAPPAKAQAIQEFRTFLAEHEATPTEASFSVRLSSRGKSTEAELKRLIAREKVCCSHLRFEVDKKRRGIVLTVSGPAEEVWAAAAVLR